MKLIQTMVLTVATLFSGGVLAEVYKCTNTYGKTGYQSTPCERAEKILKLDVKTGGMTDLSLQAKEQFLVQQLENDERNRQQQLIDLENKRLQDALEQTELNQMLVKNNPIQFSAFAIPPYSANNLPAYVQPYESRLPLIEKFRRVAAQKALATGRCRRVESDEIDESSQLNRLVFVIDCSSGERFLFNETELTE